MDRTFAVAIGGAAGQGVATPGDIFAKLFARRGLHINAYNAYQSIIRGGHILFARYLRSETSYVPDGSIRKYDGEPSHAASHCGSRQRAIGQQDSQPTVSADARNRGVASGH
jgi:hypothetical protein